MKTLTRLEFGVPSYMNKLTSFEYFQARKNLKSHIFAIVTLQTLWHKRKGKRNKKPPPATNEIIKIKMKYME